MKLSILIPHLKSYDVYLDRLRAVLDPQRTDETELIIFTDYGDLSIGFKRNWLLNKAKGEYLCFIDSDDLIRKDYIKLVMEGIDKGVDCCSLKGVITDDDKCPRTFIHSIRYTSWYEKDNVFYRNPNHLNVIKSSIAKQMKFPDKNVGEDHDYSKQLHRSGLLKTEHWIEPVIYHYLYRNK